MEKITTFLLTFVVCIVINAQQQVITQTVLSSTIDENSGLLYLNGKFITHNDSGGKSILYEFDPSSGLITREVTITNAKNIDWEDISEDVKNIYIADTGNNQGDRKNLCIYKISKEDYFKSDTVKAKKISFIYKDQENFKKRRVHNFDAEALVVSGENYYIFSKNFKNKKTKLYKLSKKSKNIKAKKIATIDVEGLITGATYVNDKIVLCGYADGLTPFVILLPTIKSKEFIRYDLSKTIGLGNQVEAITAIDDTLYFSAERVIKKIGGVTIDVEPKLYTLGLSDLTIDEQNIDKLISQVKSKKESLIFPSLQSVEVYKKKKRLSHLTNDSETYFESKHLSSGKYLLKIKLNSIITVTRELIID